MANKRDGGAEFTRFQSGALKRTVILKIAVWLMIFLFLIIAAFLFGKNLFSLKTIVINGSEHYTYPQILSAVDLAEGDFIFSVSEDEISDTLTQRFAYVKSVNLKKEYPSTVVLTIEEERPEFYFELQGEYFLLSRELRTLERFGAEDKLLESAPDAQFVQLPQVSKAIVCHPLEFAVPAESRHTDEALAILADSRLYSGITDIDFSDRFDMTLVYDGRLKIHLGSFQDYRYKLDLALGMIHAYSDQATGKLEIIYDADHELKGIATVEDPQKAQ